MRSVLVTVVVGATMALASVAGAQTPFTGTFTFGSDGNVASFNYNGTPIPGLTVSPLTKVGVSTSGSNGNFRASSWPLGALDGSDDFTGSLDPGKYFQFTITAEEGKVIDLPSITFGLGRSATGPRQWQWRSSVDGFASAIPVTTIAPGLTQDNGVLTNPDLNSSWVGNVLQTAGAEYQNLTSITFRIYAYNSEQAGGTGGLQGPLTFGGTLLDGGGGPVISSFAPGFGPVGTVVTVNGSGFGTNPTVRFNGTLAPFTTADDTQIVVEVPEGATTGPITVEVEDEPTATSPEPFIVGTAPPTAVATPAAISGLTTVQGTPSESVSYALEANNLTDDLIVGPSTSAFEVSTNNSTWAPSLTLPQVDGNLNTTVWVRLSASAPVGVAAATITNSILGSGSSFTNTPSLAGVVSGDVDDGLIAGWDFQTTVNGGTAAAASPNTPRVFIANFGSGTLYLDGANGSSSWFVPESGNTGTELNAFAGTIVNTEGTDFSTEVVGPAALAFINQTANGKVAVFRFSMAGYESLNISLAAQRTASGFTEQLWEYSTDGAIWSSIGSLVGGVTAGTITSAFADSGVLELPVVTGLDNAPDAWVRVTFTGASSGTGNNRIDNIQFRASQSSGPRINVSPASIDDLSAVAGSAGLGQPFTVSGEELTGDLTVTAPANFEVSTESATTGFGGSVMITASGTLPSTQVWVRIAATAPIGDIGPANVTVEGGGANTRTVAVSGNVSDPSAPNLEVSPTTLAGFSTIQGTPSAPQSVTITGANLTEDITITPPAGFAVSLDGVAYLTGNLIIPLAEFVSPTSFFVRLTGAAEGSPAGNVSVASSAVTRNVSVSGTVGPAPTGPTITVAPASLSGFVTDAGTPSASQQATVSGVLLEGPITVAAPEKFEVSLNNTDYSPSVILVPSGGDSDMVLAADGPVLLHDTIGDIAPDISSAGGTMDIVSMEVNSTATDLIFTLTVNGNIATTDWGNFMIGVATGKTAGTTTGNAWARPINLDSPIGGMTHWIGAWVNNGGGSQLWTYNGTGWDGPAALPAFSFTPDTQSTITYTVSQASLGVTEGDTIYFDAYSSGGGGTDSAVDALSNPEVSITEWSQPYTSSTVTGISSYTIGSGGGGGEVPPTTVYVRIAATAPVGGAAGNLDVTSPDATPREVALSGVVNIPPPSLSVDPSSIIGLVALTPAPSAPQSFSVNGAHLLADVTVQAPAGFEISLTPDDVGFGDAVTIPAPGGTVSGVPVYVRIAADEPLGPVSGEVQLSSTTATATVAVSGQVVDTPPEMSVNPASLTGFLMVSGFNSQVQTFALSGENAVTGQTVTVSTSGPFQVSLNGENWSSSLGFPAPASDFTTTVSVRINPAATVGMVTGSATATAQGLETPPTVALAGEVLARPQVAAEPPDLEGFVSVEGFPSESQTFTVSGEDLFTDVLVEAPEQFEISLDGVEWFDAISLEPEFADTQQTSGPPVIVASDTAGNYGGGWTAGSNGGFGFLPWAFIINDNSGGVPPPPYFAGAFIGDPGAAGITEFGDTAFGLYANPDNTDAAAIVDRPFISELQPGGTFSIEWAVNWDAGAGSKGFSLFAGTNQVVQVNQGNFPGDITVNGDLAISGETGFGTQPMTWRFTATDANALEITSTGRTGGTNIVYSNSIPLDAPIDLFRAYTTAMSPGDERQSYFNNLQLTAPGSASGGVVSPTQIFVRIKGDAPAGPVAGQARVSSDPYAEQKFVSLEGEVLAQVLTVDPAVLDGFSTTRGMPSQAQSFILSGTNLVENVLVAAPLNYEVSTAEGGPYSDSLEIEVPAGPFGGNLDDTPLWVRISAQATSTAPSGIVTLASGRAEADVQVNGIIVEPQHPALNSSFLDYIFHRLLFRSPTDLERADYYELLGPPDGEASPQVKAQAIMELMGYDVQVGLFDWQFDYLDLDGSGVEVPSNYVLTSLAFAPHARMGLTPGPAAVAAFIDTSRTPTTEAQQEIPLKAFTASYSPEPFGSPAGAPYGVSRGIGLAFGDLIASAPFQNAWEASGYPMTTNGFLNWLRYGWFWGFSAAGANAYGSSAMQDMVNGLTPIAYARGAVAGFRSMYQWAILAEAPSASNGSFSEGPFQRRLNLAVLDFQLWGVWSYTNTSPQYSQSAVLSLLRLPQITSGDLPTFAADQSFPPYAITATNGGSGYPASAGLPLGLYFSASNLPAGLSVNPATGEIFQTGSVQPGNYNNIILRAENFVGTGMKTVSLTVEQPEVGPASQWMMEQGLGAPGQSFQDIQHLDHDNDHFTVLQEYAFGLDPWSPDASALSQTSSGNNIILEWNALKEGATYRVKQSTNLMTWQNLTMPVPVLLYSVDTRYDRWRITIPINGHDNFFNVEAEFHPGTLD